MDPSGFEPEASALQGQRSTGLNYGPKPIAIDYEGCRLVVNKKEVIHPQVPLRVPCDDLTHLTELRFELTRKLILT
jgi:hypothetical protein